MKSRTATRTRTSSSRPTSRPAARPAAAGKAAPARPARRAAKGPSPVPRVPVVAPTSPLLAVYEKAMASLQKGDFDAAIRRFEAVAAGKEAEPVLADRARLYLEFCRRKADQQQKVRRSDEDLYASAVYEKNRGELVASLDLVKRLLKKGDDEKAHHLAAAIHAVRGEQDEALEHLRRALRKNPALIFQVRGDVDFVRLRDTPVYRKLEETARRG